MNANNKQSSVFFSNLKTVFFSGEIFEVHINPVVAACKCHCKLFMNMNSMIMS